MSKNQKGFIQLLILVAVVIVLGVAGFFVTQKFKKEKGVDGNLYDSWQQGSSNPSSPVEVGKSLSNGACEGEGVPYKLGRSPMDGEDFSIVIPYGLVTGGHVTPIDHQYFSPKDYNSPLDSYEVYAMADSWLVNIEPRERNDRGKSFQEYRLVFTITCTYFYYYDLVTSLAPEIKQEYDKSKSGFYNKALKIKVKEGQLIGKIGGQTLDFAVWDTTKPLTGYVVPEHYKSEPWKIYTADPLEYYTDGLKEFVLTRYVRTAEPISGKIDYDVDGKIVGNWFLEGTENYSGGKPATNWKYWEGHLAIVPDHIDPRGVIVSFGNFQGEEAQFLVSNLGVRPEDAGTETGIVRYELGRPSYVKANGEYWDNNSVARDLEIVPNAGQTHCALLELVEKRKLKVEYFPNTSCTEDLTFTKNAKFYFR